MLREGNREWRGEMVWYGRGEIGLKENQIMATLMKDQIDRITVVIA
jgi:hypothetical protein